MGRKEIVQGLCQVSGITWLAWRRLRSALYVFNYHRIGDPATATFDPDVFSCTEERFAEHVDLLRSRFDLIGLSQLLALIEGRTTLTRPTAMITFDDGYRDNYTKAYPVLRRTGTPAVFFVTTTFVGSKEPPWWDEVVWQARHLTPAQVADLPWSSGVAMQGPDHSRQVLHAFKRSPLPNAEKLAQLRSASGRRIDAAGAGEFMLWDEVRAMRKGGMDIGSHTHTHPILSHLGPSDQLSELATSKRIMQSELGEEVTAVAYPVGGRNAYSMDTVEAARGAGYRAAFTCVEGVNRHPAVNPFELKRINVGENLSPRDFRFAIARMTMRDRFPRA